MERRKTIRELSSERRRHLKNLKISHYISRKIRMMYRNMSTTDLLILKAKSNVNYFKEISEDFHFCYDYALSELATSVYITRILKERKKTGYEPENPTEVFIA